MPSPDDIPEVEFHRSTQAVVLIAFLLGLAGLGFGAWKLLQWLR